MSLSSVVKGVLLILILLGLMSCVLPSYTPLLRLGQGGPFNWFWIGHSVECAGAGYVTNTV